MRVFHQASGRRRQTGVLKDSKFRSDDADVPIRAVGSQRLFQRSWISTLGITDLSALGQHEVWKDGFADVEDRITSVMSDSIASRGRALPLLVERNRYPEETYPTSYVSALRAPASPKRRCVWS
jgi:hypothetical protein